MPRRYIMIIIGGFFLVSGCTNSKKINSTVESGVPTTLYEVYAQLPLSANESITVKDFASSSSYLPHEDMLIYMVNNSKSVSTYNVEGKFEAKFPIGIQGNTISAVQDFPAKYKGNIDLLVISEPYTNKLRAYEIDATHQALEDVTSGEFFSAVDEIRFTTTYYSETTNSFYLFIAGKRGMIEQWQLFDDGYGHVEGKIVRIFNVYDTPSSMSVDANNEILYIAVNNEGVFKIGAIPSSGTSPTSVITIKSNSKFLSKNLGAVFYNQPTERYKEGSLILCALDNATLWRIDIAKSSVAEQLLNRQKGLNTILKSNIIKSLWSHKDSYIFSDNGNGTIAIKLIQLLPTTDK